MSPWSGPHAAWLAGGAGDTGESADLQTDVMRFMAMLALCLVAVFALLQDLPSGREGPPPAAPAAAAAAAPEATVPPPPETAAPAPGEPAVPRRETAAAGRHVQAPAAERASTAAASAAPAPQRAAAAASPGTPDDSEGFVLRFSNDAALLSLVRDGRVALYAVDAQGVLRATASGGRLSFQPAASPARLHEMERESVPGLLRAGYARSRGQSPEAVRTWGVTLPDATRRAVDRLVAAHRGGELLIAPDGSVSLRTSGVDDRMTGKQTP